MHPKVRDELAAAADRVDDAVMVMEGVAHMVSTLSSDQRQEPNELVGEMAAVEHNQARRGFLEEFPEEFEAGTAEHLVLQRHPRSRQADDAAPPQRRRPVGKDQ
ncbi:hypothetical protein ACIBEA_16180 [Streptomyces sp. NPDC051555]|uniref:hypothetical protein n=1 Tax=Streptomyces sp. NPDC051555 TaxID=3365657 RepID=UPI0037AC448F